MLFSLLVPALALTCESGDATCLAVDAAIASANLSFESAVLVSGGPSRLDPDRMLASIERMIGQVTASGCSVDGTLWVGGAYERMEFSGDVGDELGVQGSTVGVLGSDKSFTGSWDGEVLGAVSRYDRNGRVVGSIGSDGRFFAGRWVRVRGRTGVVVGLEGSCPTGSVAAGLNRYMRGALVDEELSFEVVLRDGDGLADSGVDADTIELVIHNGDQPYDFGFAQTRVQADGGFGWFGEDCFTGSFCHPTSPTGVTLSRVASIGAITNGSSTLIPVDFPEAATPALTYIVSGTSPGSDCWVWGDDPGYYASLGCETAMATVTPPPNRAPTAGTWAIVPDDPAEGLDDLRCDATVAPFDPDGSTPATAIRWTVDGIEWAGSTATAFYPDDTVPAAETMVGETWRCEAAVADLITSVVSTASAPVMIVPQPVPLDLHTVALSLPAGARPLDLNRVPAGGFEMGCKQGRDDRPLGDGGTTCSVDFYGAGLHVVTLSRDVWIARTEITQAQWATLAPGNPSPSDFGPGNDFPVDSVSWHDAAWFANAVSGVEGRASCYVCTGGHALGDLDDPVCSVVGDPYTCEGYRIPTEAEWEYAARGGEDFRYAGGDDPLVVGWHSGNFSSGGTITQPVGSLQENGFGLFDMSGNVFEWTGDWWVGEYPTTAVVDPLGEPTGTERVLRGGFFSGSETQLQPSFRGNGDPEIQAGNVGIRLARTAF